jgi:hypothetical protein
MCEIRHGMAGERQGDGMLCVNTPLPCHYLADKHSGVHALLEQDGGVPHIVTGHQRVGVVHTGRVHCEPVDRSYRHTVFPHQLQLYHPFVDVIFVPATQGMARHRPHKSVQSIPQYTNITFTGISFYEEQKCNIFVSILQTKAVENIKTHILCSVTFFRKSYRL